MDKYEYNLKLEEIDKLVDQGDYEEAADLADTIDWRRVRNVRTLCLISEIYEEADRLEKSKDMLVRAYRKSPVGRTVLYRLVEVTTALGEYDEALEYYSEYVQVAPHDNNRYILKYMIYKGRGSSPEELIEILEEYLGQEYTERWAYELALNYQEAGQIQKCLATCDDLVLWFHSGKYVKRALELKKRYAELTPKQEEIYKECVQEEEQEGYLKESEGETALPNTGEMDGEVLAESIIAETEKEIAGAVAARRAEKEQELAEEENTESSGAESVQNEEAAETESGEEQAEAPEETKSGSFGEPAKAEAEEIPAKASREETEEARGGDQAGRSAENPDGQESSTEKPEEQKGSAEEPKEQKDGPEEVEREAEQDNLQVELAKSVRKVVSGVARKPELNEEDVPAAVEDRLRRIRETPKQSEPEPKAEKISIDDILLAMGEKGKQTVASREQGRTEEPSAANENAGIASGREKEERRAETSGREAEKMSEEFAHTDQTEGPKETAGPDRNGRSLTDVITEDLTQEQLEALKYSNNPEKFLKNKESLPVYASEEELANTREIVNTKEELRAAARKEQLEAATIRIPSEEVARAYGGEEDLFQEPEKEISAETEKESAGTAEEPAETEKESAGTEEEPAGTEEEPARTEEEPAETEKEPAGTEKEPAEAAEEPAGTAKESFEVAEKPTFADEDAIAEGWDSTDGFEEEWEPAEASEEEWATEEESLDEGGIPLEEVSLEGEDTVEENQSEETESLDREEEDEEYFDDELTLEPSLRGLFPGFTEVDGLEDQIANAILQAMSKGDDRTSRTGNILIFGAHGSGKTTLAIGIARAIAQKKGEKAARVAKIYASDLNRKDIASTIAKIAGGTLIIEEAGDLEDKTVEQLTTAMEFRTDGLIVILEDEQRYIHELLMNHPRFTMKFTAQIYLPDYTEEELLVFADQHAYEEDCRISDEAADLIAQKIADAEQNEAPLTVSDMIHLVDDAIRRSNKLTRKMSMGKKRYDEDEYILLFAKDFK